MSNGTRIDPEEREPRAIKIRQPKHTGRKIVLTVLSALLIVALGGGVFALIEYGPDLGITIPKKTVSFETEDTSSEAEIPEESASEPEIPEEPASEPEIPEEPVSEPEEPEPVVPEIPRDEWYMLLVNRENVLPEDFKINGAIIDHENHIVNELIYDDLSEMITVGTGEGLNFTFYTAYRTYEKQKELFEAGKTDVPAGASEHNSGLAVDIGCAVGEFEGSPEEAWLLEHAHEYGFILRYPEGKEEITGFAHEPWHFRYVGKEQAKLIFESGLCLEEYLAQE